MNKTPPQNLEAERSVLSAVFYEPDILGELMLSLNAKDFYLESHQIIYQAMINLHSALRPVDMLTIAAHLSAHKKLKVVGGPVMISSLGGLVSTAANVDYWAKMVKDTARQRSFITAATGLLHEAHETQEDTDAWIEEAHTRLLDSMSEQCEEKHVVAGDLYDQVMDEINTAEKEGRQRGAIETPWPVLETMTWGHRAGEVIVVSGEPGEGKTALALNVVAHNIDTKSIMIFSPDQEARDLMHRLLAIMTGTELKAFRSGELSIGDQRRIRDVRLRIKAARLYIDDRHDQEINNIRARARAVKSRHGLDFMVIDYIQLLKINEQIRGEAERLAAISHAVKSMAKDLQVPVYLLSQYNLDGRKRPKNDRTPRLSDLKGTSALGDDANLVLAPHQPWRYDTSALEGKAQLWVVKNKQGPTGMLPLDWDGTRTLFTNPGQWQRDAGAGQKEMDL